MHRIDTPGSTVDKQFQPENPALGIQATELGAEWHNAVQEEIAGIIEEAGLILDKDDNTQLLQAIRALTVSGVRTITDIYTAVATDGIILIDTTATPVTLYLPVYASVPSGKQFRYKWIAGDNAAYICPFDDRTIDGSGNIVLGAPGDRGTIIKDGTNWQTI